MKSLQVLKDVFGYTTFRPGQEKVIDLVLKGENVLAVMPTGAGKSMCYQIPALVNSGLTLVISPLISLMKDQIDSLKQNGINAAALNSATPQEEVNPILRQAYEGKIKLLYVTPERLAMDYFRYQLNFLDISLVAVDEAHCISQWGHDFRPAYRQIMDGVKSIKSNPNILALTATATPSVQKDIAEQLQIPNKNYVITSFARPNLSFKVVDNPKNTNLYLLEYIKKHPNESGIIYASTRKHVEELTDYLAQNGILTASYHAGLSNEERSDVQDAFQFDKVQVIVATNAFGMGIDKRNVRFVIHANSTPNLESYYQEAGRAGRDGERCEGILIYHPKDIRLYRWFIEQSDLADEYQKIQYQKLAMITKYVNTTECLQQFIVSYFGQRCDPCGKCSNCLGSFIEKDITSESKSIISTIYELDGRFGKTVVADVVSGANNQRMREIDAAHLRHYGSLKIGKSRVINLINYLISHNYLQLTDSQYPVVHVTNLGWDVLDNKKRVTQKISKKIEKLSQTYNPIPKEENDLFVRLKEVRLDLAKKQGIPAFYIFSDKSLREMALQKPKTKAEFLNISGVGQAKLKSYGQIMLAAIKNYLKEDAD
ncbi:DNA helicase RecQ [Lactobacillus paragasseri]|uniref:DNA helicase RecQ n=1 Tax=Lactobacillus paragasseri TaxID=2107999 RepID=UPI0012E2C5EF|nr:DNA helicase RecQ [Lactobacillus paragasseri]MDK8085710.1 DNA helicase RecQ [Lactobacillus paragasseri]MDX5117652.1 DNA helicase RecQ [Lactobacillus paragasseri]MDX5121532.1 DNA helicase RecQ [Lactobacillus paragasseri]QGT97716.1 DNA helicase RecQ [Lactobacillus paragasseri]